MWWLYILGGIIIVLISFFVIKKYVWDKPNNEVKLLKQEIESLKKSHKEEISDLKIKIFNGEKDIEKLQIRHANEIEQLRTRLNNSDNLYVAETEFVDIVISSAWKEIAELCNKKYAFLGIPEVYSHSLYNPNRIIESLKYRFSEAVEGQYKYNYLIYLFPELKTVFNGTEIISSITELPASIQQRTNNLFEVVNSLKNGLKTTDELLLLKYRVAFLESAQSNLTAIPYMAGIMADYETYGLEHLAKELDWGHAVKRLDKVKSIREIRKDARAIVEKNKESQYQLAYLLKMFPNLQDVIDTEFSQLPIIEISELSEYDSVRDYLSNEEYQALSECERNQLALDRYKQSHNKTKWQIGRDYEFYVGYRYSQLGYDVDYFGSYMGLEDLGRDIIAKNEKYTLIIQCKYWSSKKLIHENHVNQLFGTMVSYCIEHSIDKSKVRGVLITNIQLSTMAKKMAAFLGIAYKENFEIGDYPCIKCNIGHGENGEVTKIYHLPFDQQYDSTKINDKGEFFAMNVAEAEAAGFRRAFKWFKSK